tara:strand:- start:2519 stop:3598 length:1080 start_codon:yes stop_codon:yes gene_type:complete
MTKILFLNVDPKRNLAIPIFIDIVRRNINSKKFSSRYFVQGKPYEKLNTVSLIFHLFSQIIQFVKTLADYRPDVIQINPSFRINSLLRDIVYANISYIMGFKVLIFIHGWDNLLYKKVSRNFFMRYIVRSTFNKSYKSLVLSNAYKDSLINLGINKEKVLNTTVIVESSQFNTGPKKLPALPIVLYCGSLIREKGLYELLDAIEVANSKGLNFAQLIMGDGPELSSLKKIVKERKLGNVFFLGFKKGKKRIPFFQKSHVLILPSYSEGFPIVCLEAMASGMNIVSTKVGGLKDTMNDGVNGFFMETVPPNKQEIVDKLVMVLKNKDSFAQISLNNLELIKHNYDTLPVINKLEALYNDT